MGNETFARKGGDFYKCLAMLLENMDAVDGIAPSLEPFEEAGKVPAGTALSFEADAIGMRLDEEPDTVEEIDLAMESAYAMKSRVDNLPFSITDDSPSVKEGVEALLRSIAALGLMRWTMLHGDFPRNP